METIMRSLSYSPTEEEIGQYFKKYVKDDKIDFASFLEVMHEYDTKENAILELSKGFRVDALFREGNVNGSQIRYNEFIENISQPVPDY